jgi:hypothetical protein
VKVIETQALYTQPQPAAVPETWNVGEPKIGKNYEAGMWSRRNWEAMMEDQRAAVPDDGMHKAAEFLRVERDEYRRQRDIAVAAFERYAAVRNGKLAREALKEVGEVK